MTEMYLGTTDVADFTLWTFKTGPVIVWDMKFVGVLFKN